MYLGIEIGGTKLQLGVGPGGGTLRAIWRERVEPAQGPEGIREQILRAVPELLLQARLGRSQIEGIGIGFGGPVDENSRTIIKSHQIEGWDDFPLAAWISDILGWPAVLGNDSDVAALAEASFGAGKGYSPIYYLNIGSGIGGGLIINGEIYRGCGRGAAETGHLLIKDLTPNGLESRPLEQWASGWSIGRRAREELNKQENSGSVLARMEEGHNERITAEHVRQAAEQADAFALAILDKTWDHVAEAVCHVIALLCPRRIVLGGGVALMGASLFLEPLREKVARRVFKPFATCYDMVLAALGEEVVLHGALALARRRIGEVKRDGE